MSITQKQQVVPVKCAEVWGGMSQVDTVVSTPGLEASLISEPYQHQGSGGDVHFLSLCGEGVLTRLVLADVAGHGLSAAELAGTLRDLMRDHMNTLDHSSFAQELNEAFVPLGTGGRFATAVMIAYEPPVNRFVVCNAGHMHPLWYRADRGAWEVLHHRAPSLEKRVSDLPLGLIAGTPYHQFAVRTDVGDMVVGYTDSLYEARSASGTQLGEQGLLELARGLDPGGSPAEFGHGLLEAVRSWRGGAAAEDDVTLVTLKRVA